MENYFKFNRKVFVTLGVNFDGPKKNFQMHLKILTLVVFALVAFQSLLFVLETSEVGIPTALAIAVGLFDVQGCIKFITFLTKQSKLTAIRDLLTERIKLLTQEEWKMHQVDLNRFEKVTRSIILTNFSGVWMFNVLPFVTFVYFLFAKGALVQSTPLSFWYPFNKTEWYYPVYLYEVTCTHIIGITPFVIDGFILLMVGQLIVLFKCLSDTFGKIINEFEVGKREETVKRLAEAIDCHNVFFDLSMDLLGIYEIPLLINVLTQTFTICFIAFIVSVQTMDAVIVMLIGLANSLAQIFLICWFGEKLRGSSLSVYDKIQESNYHLLDPSLQKILVMVVLRSQRGQVMKASKFFSLTHTGFTSIVRGAMSYFTLINHLYNNKKAEF